MKVVGQQWILMIAVVCILAVGAQGVWISYPLSLPIPGLDWQGVGPAGWRRFLAAPFLFFLASALLLLLLGRQRSASWALVMACVSLLAVPGVAWLLDATWLNRYIEEGVQYDKFQFYIPLSGGIPSTSFDPYLNSPDKYQYLPDRARIIVDILGWGWSVCVLGMLALLGLLRRAGKISSLHNIFWPVLGGVVVIGLMGMNTLRADLNYRTGDQRLGLGDYTGALKAYTLAINCDPVLASSPVYLQNVAKAYYQLRGADDPRGQLYADALSKVNQERAKALLAFSAASPDDSALGRALSKMAERKEAELWVNQSVRAYKNGDLGTAVFGLRRVLAAKDSPSTRFFLARVLGQLREFDEAERQLKQLLSGIQNASVQAAIYNALGDVHAAAGHLEQARTDYAMSYKLDKSGNLWAIKGLGGT
ncbi:MAG: hypothetical protein Q7S51_02140 [Gallionellaceae bacterium]|nr:hypothetical protein [Gallionellaceae bacterium]